MREQHHHKKNIAANLIYGIHAVSEAVSAGKDVQKVLVVAGNRSEQLTELLHRCRQAEIPVTLVPKEKFNFLKDKTHQGIAAYLSSITYHKIEHILPGLFEEGKVPLLMVLDKITDVRNFGAIARSALNGGVDALIVPLTDSAPATDDAIRTSAGALLKIPVCREKNLKTTLEFLNQCGVATIACSEKAKQFIFDADLRGPVAFVVGSEETGISNELLRKCHELVKIPMEEGVSSLNVSVAAGIAIYEAVRQRMEG